MMTNFQQELILRTEKYVRNYLEKDASGHDWWHIERVRKLALTLAEKENADLFIVEIAALLHDVGDHKFHDGDHTQAEKLIRDWLTQNGLDIELIDRIYGIVERVSFKGANVSTPMSDNEGKVVQDADRLDALGAVGIARTFAYGGHKGRQLYDPDRKPEFHNDFESYKISTAPTINHFYEKLLLLKDRMNTVAGKRMAENRHRYMENYLEQFFYEWEGKK